MERRRMAEGIVLLLAAALLASSGCSMLRRQAKETAKAPPDYSLKGKVIQRLQAFENPEGAVFSADGRYVFITNSAELGAKDRGFHWVERAGFISKLEVLPDGTLKMVNLKLVDGLTGPLGMAVSTKSTKTFPQGTIFVCTGNLPLADTDSAAITDPSRHRVEIIAFDEDGNLYGSISWGRDSALAQVSGGPAAQPNGMAFDKEGNLYLADTGMGGRTLNPPLAARPGVMMIPHAALDDLAAERTPSARPVFLPVPGGPDGVDVCPTDRSVHVNTVGLAAGMEDANKGGMFRLTQRDFARGICPAPFASGFGALDGLTFLPNGTRLDTQVLDDNYLLVTPPGHKPMRLALDPDVRFNGCADIAVRTMPDGSHLLVIPQLSAFAANEMKDEVTVARLPKDFGTVAVPRLKPEAKPAPTKTDKKAPAPAEPEPKKAAPAPKRTTPIGPKKSEAPAPAPTAPDKTTSESKTAPAPAPTPVKQEGAKDEAEAKRKKSVLRKDNAPAAQPMPIAAPAKLPPKSDTK